MEAMKDSGIEWIGEIPESWEMGRISHRCDLKLGKMVESDAGNSNRFQYPYICAANVKWGGIDTTICKEMHFGALERAQYEVLVGDLLITEGGSVGTSCIYNGEFGDVCYMQNSVIRVRSSSELANQFLCYWFEFVAASGYLDCVCNRATIAHYTKDKVAKTPLVLMMSQEMCLIAKELNFMLEPLAFERQLIEKQIKTLEKYRASVIHEAVTNGLDSSVPMKSSGVEWIGDIPTTWNVKKLKHLIIRFESGTSVRAASYPADTKSGENGVLSLSAVFGGQYNAAANKRIDDDEVARATCPVRTHSLLVSRCNTSEWVGLPAIVEEGDDRLFLPDKLWQIDSGSYLMNKYLWYALRSKGAREYCRVISVGASSSMQNISSIDLRNLWIALPANVSEMQRIVDYLDFHIAAIDAVVETRRKQLDVLRRRRQSLIYEYVTGKRRVSEVG